MIYSLPNEDRKSFLLRVCDSFIRSHYELYEQMVSYNGVQVSGLDLANEISDTLREDGKGALQTDDVADLATPLSWEQLDIIRMYLLKNERDFLEDVEQYGHDPEAYYEDLMATLWNLMEANTKG